MSQADFEDFFNFFQNSLSLLFPWLMNGFATLIGYWLAYVLSVLPLLLDDSNLNFSKKNAIDQIFKDSASIAPALPVLGLFLTAFLYKAIIEYIHGYLPKLNLLAIAFTRSIALAYSLSVHQTPTSTIIFQNFAVMLVQNVMFLEHLSI